MPLRPSAGAVPGRGLLAVVAAAGLALGATVLVGAPSPAPATAGPQVAAPPSEQALPEPPVDASDAALRPGLTAYHDVARRLNAVAARSDRVTTEVVGRSGEGRDLVLVTLTAPETPEQVGVQERMRARIVADPAMAALDRALARDYRLPVLVSANVHGDEPEGTDALLRLVEDWAVSDDPEVMSTLETTRLHLLVTANPDGRVARTRANAAGFDLNRDLVTASQPETVALRDAIVRLQPVMLLDLHGYVNGTLVEPTTAPWTDTTELDLLLPHAWANALGVEEALRSLPHDEADGVRTPQIPLRDLEGGWDGWPPIFTPQYAALHGVVAQTVEVPLRINASEWGRPEEELRRRAAINTDVAEAAVTATLRYAVEHRAELLADHVEVFRRGAAGEEQRRPGPEVPVPVGERDWTTDLPRAYVLPAGDGQRSAPAAARLVDHLVANGVEVLRLTRPAEIGGTVHPAGSHVVDLHQARRGLAATFLGPGTDLSPRIEAMYDMSAWSHGLLWGATVVTVPAGTDLEVTGEPVATAAAPGSVAPSTRGWLLPLEDPADVQALTDLLADGVALEWLDDGSVLVPTDAGTAARAVAREHGVELDPAPAGASGEAVPDGLRLGVAGTPQERWACAEMGLTVETVGTAELNAGLDLSGLDALYVSDGLAWDELGAAARAELRAFVADGGGLVGRGRAGADLDAALDLLDVRAVQGRADANGIVAVDNADGPVAGGAPDHAFVYAPVWFTDLGEGVVAEQRLAAGTPLVSGHWRPDRTGSRGPDEAAGEALVVRGEDASTGARVVLLGSDPLFRAHPKGTYATVARALLWSALGD
ncbi:zinc carboxypeptidase [Ornithinimicrobium humiphilum]|uniref:Zinc carboxypeptidase n=1 Tax=Ornithinimicrobium humiphilum TaxID=125288 RepID=A0A543KKV7_9MICO|nr:M14 family zinc carboxypeptidase [Ornithinimicrobium humiphilum]TQM95712.1 zinc carboxypeptidase [Ornithinimicrobium humiphilum]